MKYLKLFTNRYCLAITAIGLLALLCIMATSEWTLAVVLVKIAGFGLIGLMARLYNMWDRQGKVDAIKELFNDEEMTKEQPFGEPEENHRNK